MTPVKRAANKIVSWADGRSALVAGVSSFHQFENYLAPLIDITKGIIINKPPNTTASYVALGSLDLTPVMS